MDDAELLPEPGRLSVPSEMVAEIAAGLEEPRDIAFRYGIAGASWESLTKWVPFQNAVAAQKAEYEKSGFTFKVKAKVLTEDVFEHAYKIARSNDSTLLQKLEFIKVGAKLADMEPKANQAVASGPGFSITINLGTQAPQTIDVDAIDTSEERVHKTDKIEHVHETSMKTTAE